MTEEAQPEPSLSTTASKIVAAATRLFMQRGYRAVSINDIIQAAGVTKPTLYYYFADKEELFVQMGLSLLGALHNELAQALASHTHEPTPARLTAVASVLLASRDSNMMMMRHEMGQHLSHTNQRRLSTAFVMNLFRPVYSLMEELATAGLSARYTSSELTLLFLAICSSFHEFSGGDLAWAGHSVSKEIFAPATAAAIFLRGVAREDG